MEEKQALAEATGASSGRQFQGILDALHQRTRSKSPKSAAEPVETDFSESKETDWRQNLFVSPKKKLQARWEQVSPTLKEKLHKYSPRALRELLGERGEEAEVSRSHYQENVAAMEDCSQMLAERQSKYKQIAAFYLEDTTPSTSKLNESYLTSTSQDNNTYLLTSHGPTYSTTYQIQKQGQWTYQPADEQSSNIISVESVPVTAVEDDNVDDTETLGDNGKSRDHIVHNLSKDSKRNDILSEHSDILLVSDTSGDFSDICAHNLTVESVSDCTARSDIVHNDDNQAVDSDLVSNDDLEAELNVPEVIFKDVIEDSHSIVEVDLKNIEEGEIRSFFSVDYKAPVIGEEIQSNYVLEELFVHGNVEFYGKEIEKISDADADIPKAQFNDNSCVIQDALKKEVFLDNSTSSKRIDRTKVHVEETAFVVSREKVKKIETVTIDVTKTESNDNTCGNRGVLNEAVVAINPCPLNKVNSLPEDAVDIAQEDRKEIKTVFGISAQIPQTQSGNGILETQDTLGQDVIVINSSCSVKDNYLPEASTEEVVAISENDISEIKIVSEGNTDNLKTKSNDNTCETQDALDKEVVVIKSSSSGRGSLQEVCIEEEAVHSTENDISEVKTASEVNTDIPKTQSNYNGDTQDALDREVVVINIISSEDSSVKAPVGNTELEVKTVNSEMGTPHIFVPLPDANHLRKSPVTVQEWVDHLPVKVKITEDRADEPMDRTSMLRCEAATRLSREASVQSSSSLDSLLDARRPDPVEILLNLGFGGSPGIDLENCRIPKRFLIPSKCKGGDWNEFLKRELLQIQNFECASLGFRGLSGPNHQRPSAIVANIMEKLRERAAPRPQPRTRFTSVARRVLSETSVLNKLNNHSSNSLAPSTSSSVLTPDNRKFLDSQGKISPEVPRRRIIFGQKSFAIDKDGELVEVEPSTPSSEKNSGASSGGSTKDSSQADLADSEPEHVPTVAELLRMRRSSLQRQRKVEEALEDEEDHPAGLQDETQMVIPEIWEPGKGPWRLRSSSSLQLVPEDSDDLRGELAAQFETLSRRVQTVPREELAAILEPINEIRVKLGEL